MKTIYKKILEKALDYYKSGRKTDIAHVKWLVKNIPQVLDEAEVDFDLLMPLVILHDVGYAKTPKNLNPYDLRARKIHAEEGAKIAETILKEVNYPESKIKEIKRLVLKHDDWSSGETFEKEPILRAFNNFDFMWKASKERFEWAAKEGGDLKKFYHEIEELQKKNEAEGRKWFNQKVEEHYKKLMKERYKEVFG